MATMKLELVPVPVSDIDRAKAFYTEKVGFDLDHDVRPAPPVRVVQLTPPGSACSIVLGEGLPGIVMPSGCLRGLHLVVDDIRATRDELIGRGVDVEEVVDMGGILYAEFHDPDGNTWALQQIRRAGRDGGGSCCRRIRFPTLSRLRRASFRPAVRDRVDERLVSAFSRAAGHGGIDDEPRRGSPSFWYRAPRSGSA